MNGLDSCAFMDGLVSQYQLYLLVFSLDLETMHLLTTPDLLVDI